MQGMTGALVTWMVLLAVPAVAQQGDDRTAQEWFTLAESQYRAGQHAQSADSYAKCIAAGATHPTVFYNAACSSALAGRREAAVAHLEGALARGFRDVSHLQVDADLTSLHEDPRWPALVRRCEEVAAEFVKSLGAPALREELLAMERVDQAARRGESIPELEGRTAGDVDAAHTARMKEIVATHGWPGKSLVGRDGAFAAWLLVQHADQDPAFQRRCLELMREQPEGQVEPRNLAYLTDRVHVNEGLEQVYGTQFWTVDGELVPRPIVAPAGVDARRSSVGLGTLAEYAAMMTGR
ncbi:MAG: DUF6624 domain-containing protein [Acidobacteriota bacterium]